MLNRFLGQFATKKTANIVFLGPNVDDITALVNTLYPDPSNNDLISIGDVIIKVSIPSAEKDHDGTVYLIDASNSESLSQSRADLNLLLRHLQTTKPVLILGPKSYSAGEAHLRKNLDLPGVCESHPPFALFIYSISISSGSSKSEGLDEAFQWLVQNI